MGGRDSGRAAEGKGSREKDRDRLLRVGTKGK